VRIYLASSWRNPYQPSVVRELREFGFHVYDFRNPKPGDKGFAWSAIDENWLKWTPEEFFKALKSPVAQRGFNLDWNAMVAADVGVLLLPCGRSAHLEAGYFVGAKKPLFILCPTLPEPELMYKMADGVAANLPELVSMLLDL
jgi:hypothetical protein